MIDKETVFKIHCLNKQGISIQKIARKLNIDRRTVKKYLQNPNQARKKVKRPSKLDHYHDFISQTVKNYPGITAPVLLCHLRDKEFDGKITIVSDYLIKNRALILNTFCKEIETSMIKAELYENMVKGKPYLTIFQKKICENAVKNDRFILKENDRLFIVKCGRQGKYKKWRFGVAVDMLGSGFNVKRIAEILCIDRRTVSEILQKYGELGIEGAFYRKHFSNIRVERAILKTRRIFEILHQSPRSFGINRSNWSHASIATAYERSYGLKVSTSCVGDLIRKAGYSLKKARNVLRSHDPDYREKVELLLDTLHNLNSDELLFFIDESGPMRVKKYGGRSYTKTGEYKKIPQNQISKGSVTFSSALSATTNQLSWIYDKTKNTSSMIDLIEILFNQHYHKRKLYITWDAASWHSSNELIEWLNDFNAQTKRISGGPLIEFIPLPNGSQFLNIIESVFSTMKKAVIHNSNYGSEEEMKSAISLHFIERNDYFKKNPKRAGEKIWEIDFFKDYNNIKSGNYREY